MKTKSIIDSDELKNAVFQTIEKALMECAVQHEYHAEPYNGIDDKVYEPSEQMIKFATRSPCKLKISLEFSWDDSKNPKKPEAILCSPVIDLTTLSINQDELNKKPSAWLQNGYQIIKLDE